MNWSKFKFKKICTVYQVTDSYHFNNKHSAGSFLNTIESLLDKYCLLEGRKCSGWKMTSEYFRTTVYKRDRFDCQIDCEINFETTTLTITVKE